MAKCSRCGRSGLFLKVNSSGLCEDCQRKAQEYLNLRSKFDSLDKEFQKIQKQHLDLLTKIRPLRGKAIQGKDPKMTNDCVKLCEKDIALAPEFIRLYRDHQKAGQALYGWNNTMPQYGSFEILAQIRYRQGDSQEAIRLCQRHIDMGFGGADKMKEQIELFQTPYGQTKPSRRKTGGSNT